jgi:hypothetical protein
MSGSFRIGVFLNKRRKSSTGSRNQVFFASTDIFTRQGMHSLNTAPFNRSVFRRALFPCSKNLIRLPRMLNFVIMQGF